MAAQTSGRRLGAVALPRADLRLLVGLALVAVALVGGLSLWRQAQVTLPVVIAAREIAPGQLIERADLELTQARLEGPLAALTFGEAELSTLVGSTAATAIHAGELVVRPDLGTGPLIGPDQGAVTMPVQADAVYALLRRGDDVAVMATSDEGKPQSLTQALLERATVFEVAFESSRVSLGGGGDSEQNGRLTNVTLLIPRTEAERVAHAVVNAQLTLLLLAPAPAEGSQP
jgi:Flp pilus assembly protein CpaB